MIHWVKMVRFVLGLCLLSLIGIAYISYVLCRNSTCLSSEQFHLNPKLLSSEEKNRYSLLIASRSTPKIEYVSFEEALREGSHFDLVGRDVIVFLHIQKTGGTTFGRHLVKDLNLEEPCICPRKRKRCDCIRPDTDNEQWLFSRYSTGWKCGLHADWTELTECVEDALDEYEGSAKKRRYFFITVLRNPVHRYLSEFRHVQRGATWKSSRHWCGGQDFTSLPHCYKGANWTGVELDEFMNCSYNLAHNRQTRMLADLNLVGCYNSTIGPGASNNQEHSETDRIMLQSAKQNLARMAFFGLTEQQSISQYIFERTFRLDFATPFEQSNATLSAHAMAELTPQQLERVQQLNRLDAELYEYGRQLLHERFELMKRQDPQFESHWLRILRHRLVKPSSTDNSTTTAVASSPAI